MLGSCKLLRQIAHVSVTTFQDQRATGCHFFTRKNGAFSSNEGIPVGFEGRFAAARADARVVRCRFAVLPSSFFVDAIETLPPTCTAARAYTSCKCPTVRGEEGLSYKLRPNKAVYLEPGHVGTVRGTALRRLLLPAS